MLNYYPILNFISDKGAVLSRSEEYCDYVQKYEFVTKIRVTLEK